MGRTGPILQGVSAEAREYLLQIKHISNSIMMMPDIRDKMPGRPFLPRTISSKLSFSTLEISRLREIFLTREGSGTDNVILSTLHEHERPPSRGEMKQCMGSAKDKIDFATSTLGRSIVLRSTENVNGSTREVVIGDVREINVGAVTESVWCHQSLYPYLVYYCHSVPKVRVYKAEILDCSGKSRINRGVAVYHVNTSACGPGRGASWLWVTGQGRLRCATEFFRMT